MSLFRYHSKHKVVIGLVIVISVGLTYTLTREDRPTFDNGQEKRNGPMRDGRNHGNWVWYYQNGNRKMQGRFADGERIGTWVTFSEQGDTLTVSQYENDRLNGFYKVYGPDGNVVHTLWFRDDVLLR